MTLPQVDEIFRYWEQFPPEHELLQIALRVYTNWRPHRKAEENEAGHRASLEARWNAGAMNAKQMFEAMGGRISLDGSKGAPVDPRKMPGIGPFPGTMH